MLAQGWVRQGTSLVVQWLRLCTSIAGAAWFRSLVGELGSCMPRHAAREKKKGWVRQESRLTQAWGRGREKVIFTRTRKSQRRPDLKKERNSRLPSGHAGLRGLWNHVDGSQVARTEGQRGH